MIDNIPMILNNYLNITFSNKIKDKYLNITLLEEMLEKYYEEVTPVSWNLIIHSLKKHINLI